MSNADLRVELDGLAERKKPAFRLGGIEDFAWAACAIILSMASAREWLGISRDYYEYFDYYQTIPSIFSISDTRFEPGFHLIAWAFAYVFGQPFWVFVFAVVLIAITVKIYLIRRYIRYPIIALIVYIATFYPNQEYTQIRAAAAISLGMLAIHFFLDRKILPSIVSCLVAFSFHYSIVLLIAVFFAAYYLRKSLILPAIAATIVVAGVLLILPSQSIRDIIVAWFSSLNPLVGNYAYNLAAIDAASILSINNIIIVAIIISAILSGWLTNNLYQKCFTIMFSLSIVFVVVLQQSPIIAVRAKEMLLVSIIFAAFSNKIKQRDVVTIALILLYAALVLFLAIREGVILSST